MLGYCEGYRGMFGLTSSFLRRSCPLLVCLFPTLTVTIRRDDDRFGFRGLNLQHHNNTTGAIDSAIIVGMGWDGVQLEDDMILTVNHILLYLQESERLSFRK